MLIDISKCCPTGMQIVAPGGLSFNPLHIAGLEADRERLVIHFVGGSGTTVLFHRNVDGGPPDIYGLKRNIEQCINDAARTQTQEPKP